MSPDITKHTPISSLSGLPVVTYRFAKVLQQKWIDEADGRKFEWREIELVEDANQEKA